MCISENPKKMQEKLIYYFSQSNCEGNAAMRNLLGGKGANLAEMCNIGIPVPPGFTISTAVCQAYCQDNELSCDLRNEIKNYMAMLESDIGCKFGDSNNPLLVSIRSGSVNSMPGMLDTVLNVGLNDATVVGLAKKSGERFAYDSYCRFIMMYSNVVLQLDHHLFQDVVDNEQQKRGAKSLADLDVDVLKGIVNDFKDVVYEEIGKNFPQNVEEQLLNSVNAVFSSWQNDRAVSYRKINNIPENLGTAVNVQAMVFGNLNDNSATGVIFTRNPSTGEKKLFGEFLVNAQGEDVVSGVYTPMPIDGEQESTMEKLLPSVYRELCTVCEKLERHNKDMQDIEFTVQDGKLWILQTRSGKRTAEAAIRIIVDMVNEGAITKEEGILRIDPKTFDNLLHPVLDVKIDQEVIGKGLPASPGVASGYIVFSASDAEKAAEQGKKVILVRSETSPEDINGMNAASGIITARGGMTSHAAVVTRGMGKPCICSLSGLYVDKDGKYLSIGDIKINKGEPITIDGGTGEVMLGILPTVLPELSQEFKTIINWVDKIKTVKVRANADTPKDAKIAKEFGAEGIGLCRTEHMFFANDRIEFIQKLIIADDENERANALNKLEEMQKSDFKEMFSIMEGKEVTIRLLDPPLHEFLPHDQSIIEKIARSLNKSVESVKNKIVQLSEKNPMLGHRGCRLAISHPEIYKMQIRAILRAASELRKEKKIEVKPEIMIPFIISEKEFVLICELVKKEAKNFDVNYSIGTMIELPRAALIADKLAKHAEFFSFGTNDLTQTTMGLSRDDSVNFLDSYKESNIFKNDPFEVLDVEGVGELIRIAIERGKKTRKEIKLGICGEHGANPQSIEFFIKSGVDYVSCSPYRVPVAKLVAAQLSISLLGSTIVRT
ncbi:pyruvate, phosphate dikinase [Wolbachia endosymbiont of Drosophila mauritiana]|uniref:pyruvate, phosphate dikinase n=1 Tax=unclassified Wolbachia TaxID=2640676 RepID=UPI00107E8011|nr:MULTISPECIES: pyruvate, phosphate dikinase [unclassified Wolbachia]QCB62386.1 pyruvate, phosphate dikinase [Wolbachia endosymbiont of Drosophila mauritiana]QCB63433.1 pyruvate, phosphate dikinase [Wolbachia endosymbiont of Drosophila mauritiana]TGB06730.1 pyruvate, phosphate dikinase [Wolbachia endosymbiont of Drosophila mauritiana]